MVSMVSRIDYQNLVALKDVEFLSDLKSDGFIEAKRVYVALLDVCIACLVSR